MASGFANITFQITKPINMMQFVAQLKAEVLYLRNLVTHLQDNYEKLLTKFEQLDEMLCDLGEGHPWDTSPPVSPTSVALEQKEPKEIMDLCSDSEEEEQYEF